ncbi:MAG: DUF4174 domain-containing protein [Chroococcidiopsidaceae cyanobacterium CP_BM_RX_35]|nr:DUF4174 domain-containing protein [Chroococcidiopsidaceae cyanobacterium CP_BM_RX_35]
MSDLPKTSIHSSQPETLSIASTPERSEVGFNLSQHQWHHRVVLIFAPSERSPAYQQQMQQWQAYPEGIRERDLKLVEVLVTGESRADGQPITPASAERLRQQFGITPEDFTVILVGKDGTEKQRERVPVDPTVLFRTIDAMPMRQQEMRSRQ